MKSTIVSWDGSNYDYQDLYWLWGVDWKFIMKRVIAQHHMACGNFSLNRNQFKRLWHFSSSINSFFKFACTAIQWARCLNFGQTLSISILYVCKQRRLWRDCAEAWLAWAFTGPLCDKYHNLMSWIIEQPLCRFFSMQTLPWPVTFKVCVILSLMQCLIMFGLNWCQNWCKNVNKWASSRGNLSSGVCDQSWLKPACTVTEAS